MRWPQLAIMSQCLRQVFMCPPLYHTAQGASQLNQVEHSKRDTLGTECDMRWSVAPSRQCHFARKNRERQGGRGRWWPQRPGPQGPTSEGLCQPCSGPAPAGASAAKQWCKGQEPTGLSLATTVPRSGRQERVWVSPPDARLLGQLSPCAANSQAPAHTTQCLSAQRSLWVQGLPGPHSWTHLLWLMPRGPRQLQLTPALRQSLQKIW